MSYFDFPDAHRVREHAAAYQMEQEALRQRVLTSIDVERSNYRNHYNNEPRYVILGRREYMALRSSPVVMQGTVVGSVVEMIYGLEIIEAARRESFIAVCDNVQG